VIGFLCTGPHNVTVGGAVAHPAAGSEPDVRLSHSSGSSVTWDLVNGTARRVPGRDSVREATSGWNTGCFSGRRLDGGFPSRLPPLPSHVPGSRQPIPSIAQGIRFLSHPSHRRLRMALRVFLPVAARCSMPSPSKHPPHRSTGSW
jgi:hypothetical protein